MSAGLKGAPTRIVVICLFVALGSRANTQGRHTPIFSALPITLQKEAGMMNHASGTFEVKLTPRSDTADNKTLGRMTIDKRWQGDLEGASKGEMLTAGTGVEGSAGYVAIETMTGTLNGRKGTFILQHNGIMSRGEGQLTIIVVPDSGTDQLAGLAGKMTIKIENGKHFYDFEYTLAH